MQNVLYIPRPGSTGLKLLKETGNGHIPRVTATPDDMRLWQQRGNRIEMQKVAELFVGDLLVRGIKLRIIFENP